MGEKGTKAAKRAGSSPVGSAFIFYNLRGMTLEILRPFPVHVPLDVSLTGYKTAYGF
jgi:hypothetical protein